MKHRAKILRLRRKGVILKDIAIKCGISKQRVFQILGKTGRVAPPRASRNSVLYQYKYGARIRCLIWELTAAQFTKFTDGKCYYCGLAPSNTRRAAGGKRAPFVYNGIDRKDNKVGYTRSNCVSCCKLCNFAKRNLGYTEFIEWLDRIKHFNR